MLLAKNWMPMLRRRMKNLVVRNRISGHSTTITPLAEDSKYLKLVARTVRASKTLIQRVKDILSRNSSQDT